MDDKSKPNQTTDEELNDESGFAGSMSNPDQVEKKDTLEEAQDMGLHQDADEEHPDELGQRTWKDNVKKSRAASSIGRATPS